MWNETTVALLMPIDSPGVYPVPTTIATVLFKRFLTAFLGGRSPAHLLGPQKLVKRRPFARLIAPQRRRLVLVVTTVR